MSKSNPEKLEALWEITLVSERDPAARNARQAAPVQCRHWKWEGWELIHTGFVGILLNPEMEPCMAC